MALVFTTPILSVTPDAIRDLDGREALTGLWTVFSKCKGSLQDGPRLENIAWRLWHQEMKGPNTEHVFDRNGHSLSEKALIEDKSAYRPPTPSEAFNLPPPYPEPPSATTAASLTPEPISGGPTPLSALAPPSPLLTPTTPHTRRFSSTSNRRSSFLGGSPRSVGKIICDLVPISPSSSSSDLSGSSSTHYSDLLSEAPLSRKPPSSEAVPPALRMSMVPSHGADGAKPSSISLTDVNTSMSASAVSCLPTPEMEEGELSANATLHSSYTPQPPSHPESDRIVPQSSYTSAFNTSFAIATSTGSTTNTRDSVLSGQSNQPLNALSEPPRARFSDTDSVPSHISQPTSSINLLQLQPPTPDLPSHPPPSVLSHNQPPRLVVSHPTPNPTPHPTPPTTPLINGVIPLGGHRPVFLSPPGMNGPSRQPAFTLLEEEAPSVLNLRGLTGVSILDHPGAQSGIDLLDQSQAFDRSKRAFAEAATAAAGDYTLRPAATILMDTPTTKATMSIGVAALLSGPSITPSFDSDQLSFMEDSPAKSGSPRKHKKRHSRDKSVSSITSEVSHTTSHTTTSNRSSITSGVTVSTAFSSDIDAYHATGATLDKLSAVYSDLKAPSRFEMNGLTSETVAALERLGSLSTIHSSSTLGPRQDTLDMLEGKDRNVQMVLVSDDEFEDDVDEEDEPPTPLSPGLPLHPDTAAKKAKRNSAPPQLISSALTFSPTNTATSERRPPSVARSTSSTASTKRKSRTTTAGSNTAIMSRQSSSSRTRSEREEKKSTTRLHSSASNLAQLAGLGGGVAVVAAAYPPPTMSTTTARKQMTVGGAGKARSRVVLGKGVRARAVVRRNSAGPGVDLSGAVEPVREEVVEKGTEIEVGKTDVALERKLSQKVVQMGFDDVVRAPMPPPPPPSLTQDRRSSEPVLSSQTHPLVPVEESVPLTVYPATTTTTQPPVTNNLTQAPMTESPASITGLAQDPIPAKPTRGSTTDSVGLPPRTGVTFNIGSNSDEGKSAGSTSSISGAQSFGQRFALMGGQQRLVGKGNGRLMVDEDKLQVRLLEEEERQRQEEKELRQRQQETHAQLMAINQPRMLSKADARQLQLMQAVHTQQQLARISSKPPSRQASAALLAPLVPEPPMPSEKAKGKSKALASPPTTTSSKHGKNKSKSTPNLAKLDPDLAAKVNELAEPLLPKGRRVVVATESEYETESEDGSWSSAAMSDENGKQAKIKKELVQQQEKSREEAAVRQEDERLLRQFLQRKERNQPAAQPSIQRSVSAQLPLAHHPKASKAANHRARQTAQALHHAKLDLAAKEAQRQRDMIKKVPTESYQDLAKLRANSVGLLSQLLNPNPEIFPANHPYRRGYSQGNIRPPLQPMQPTTSEPGPTRTSGLSREINAQKSTARPPVTAAPPVIAPKTEQPIPDQSQAQGAKANPPAPPASRQSRRHASTDETKKRFSRPGLLSPTKAPPMPLTKSSAAMPVSSVVQAGSVVAPTVVTRVTTATASNAVTSGNAKMTSPGGYRPRGPPKDQEMEDDSGSEDNGAIAVPKSVAEQRLKALAAKRGIRSPQAPQQQAGLSKQLADDDVPEWARVTQPPQQQQQPPSARRAPVATGIRPTRTAPIPLGHPYNLPPPAPPTTPRTTRRQMLSTELSESLRRNLLWERQITKSGTTGMKRTASAGGSRHSAVNNLPPMPRVVQLHAKGTIQPEQQEGGGVLATDQERDEMRRHAMARNRSWANDYHYAGW